MSKEGTRELYELVMKNLPLLSEANRCGHVMPSYKTVQRRIQKHSPPVTIKTEHINIKTGRVAIDKNMVCISICK